MPKATYKPRNFVCNRWPGLQIRHMRFVGGLYTAKTREEEDVIRNADGFGIHIFPQDGDMDPQVYEALKAAEEALAAAEPAVRHGSLGTRRV